MISFLFTLAAARFDFPSEVCFDLSFLKPRVWQFYDSKDLHFRFSMEILSDQRKPPQILSTIRIAENFNQANESSTLDLIPRAELLNENFLSN
jgi:hypothetical protein